MGHWVKGVPFTWQWGWWNQYGKLALGEKGKDMDRLSTLKEAPTQFDRTAPGQVTNSSGAFVFEADLFDRLERFLILGTESGSYYATRRQLTRENAAVVGLCLEQDARRTVRLIVEVSTWGRSPSQTPCLLALAMVLSAYTGVLRDAQKPRRGFHPEWNVGHRALDAFHFAAAAVPLVVRTGAHLFEFVGYVNAFRGWGSGLRRAIGEWYLQKEPRALYYQLCKYQQRKGWSHRDVLRKVHPKSKDFSEMQRILIRYAVTGARSDGQGRFLLDERRVLRIRFASESLVEGHPDGTATADRLALEVSRNSNAFYGKMFDSSSLPLSTARCQYLDTDGVSHGRPPVVPVSATPLPLATAVASTRPFWLGETMAHNARLGALGRSRIVIDRRYESQLALGELPELLAGFEELRRTESERRAVELIARYDYTWEMVPSRFLKRGDVWIALLPQMPLGALVRNLGRMTSLGVFTDARRREETVRKLTDGAWIARSRLHPVAFLKAQGVYASGHGVKGQLRWEPEDEITTGLGNGFYAAFDQVQPVGKPLCLCLDISDSMGRSRVESLGGITAREAAAAMALVTLRQDPDAFVCGFSRELVRLVFDSRATLSETVRAMSGLPFGNTNCALPFQWAASAGQKFEGFVVYTDNETNSSSMPPHLALEAYRKWSGLPARLAVVSFVPNAFTIADPKDKGMLDFVGFDSAAPAVLADFLRGSRVLEEGRPMEELGEGVEEW